MLLQNNTCSCKRGCGGFLSENRCSGTNDTKKNNIIYVLTNGDKVAKANWRIISSIRRNEEEKIEREWDNDHGYP